MQEVGFELFTDMLNQAVREAERRPGTRTSSAAWRHHGNQPARPALLPDGYCADVHERLSLYKRLATCETEQIDAIHEELIDRFGLPPQAVKP